MSATETKTVLHVGFGSGARKLHETFTSAEWEELRVDVDPSSKPDVLCSITDMSQVASESVDAVWSSHNIEHLYAHQVSLALREFSRVLKPGGLALITVPDIQEVARQVAAGNLEQPLYGSAVGPISALDVIYGHRNSIARGDEYAAHKTGFTAQSLARQLIDAGFEMSNVTVYRKELALWATANK